MLEKLFPLALPPGYLNNGTTYQAKGRWFTGTLVRFFQGTIQPIGGWVQRSLSGATILGTPNAAISWRTNAGASFLAIGTSTNLYIVANNTQVYDITPFGITDSPPYDWHLESFGTYLVAVNAHTTYQGHANQWVWTGTLGNPAYAIADPVSGIGDNPLSSYSVVATPERFLVLLRGSDAPGAYGLRPGNIVP
jgi:hypothetical protein